MLYFLIPLRSRRVTPDWEATCRCLALTLRSAANQTSDDFRILLMCHEPPVGIPIPTQCKVLTVPFGPPPEDIEDLTSGASLEHLRADKGRKLLFGLNEARARPESHVMFLDADDYHVRRYVVHAYIAEDMRKRGTPLAPLPFPGGVYTFNDQNLYASGVRTADSLVRSMARIILKGRPFVSRRRQEFLPWP